MIRRSDTPACARGATIAWLALAAAAGALRILLCTSLPVNTGDLQRHLTYGLLVNQRGLSAAGLALRQVDPGYAPIAWSQIPYNYPVLTLGFFSILVRFSTTVFFAKLVLSGLEAVNAYLVYRCTRDRWLSLLYWISPVSLWWVSREAQFEPLQNLLVLTALYWLSHKRTTAAWGILALAIQVKAFAVLLLPWFLYRWWQDRAGWKPWAAFALCLAPTGAAQSCYPAVQNMLRYSATLAFNPYYWNPRWSAIYQWTPIWLRWTGQLATYGLLICLGYVALRKSDVMATLAPGFLVVLLKVMRQVQFWYVLMLPPFLIGLRDRRWRWALWAAVPLLDLYSAAQMLGGPFGYVVNYYSGLTTFTPIRLLP